VEQAMNGGGLTTDMEEIVAGVSRALAALEVDDAELHGSADLPDLRPRRE